MRCSIEGESLSASIMGGLWSDDSSMIRSDVARLIHFGVPCPPQMPSVLSITASGLATVLPFDSSRTHGSFAVSNACPCLISKSSKTVLWLCNVRLANNGGVGERSSTNIFLFLIVAKCDLCCAFYRMCVAMLLGARALLYCRGLSWFLGSVCNAC